MKNRLLFFSIPPLQSDVLRAVGSAIKVSGGRTFDVPDLRSRRQAYVLAAPAETAVTCIPMRRRPLRGHTNQVV